MSQYDFAKLGFKTEIAEPASFDYLDGKNLPGGFFRSLINTLFKINHVEDLFPSSPTWWADLKVRAQTEKNDLLKLNELNLELENED